MMNDIMNSTNNNYVSQRYAVPPYGSHGGGGGGMTTGAQSTMGGYITQAQGYIPSGYYGDSMNYLSSIPHLTSGGGGGGNSRQAVNASSYGVMNVASNMGSHVTSHMTTGQMMGYPVMDGLPYLSRGTTPNGVPEYMDSKDWAKFQNL